MPVHTPHARGLLLAAALTALAGCGVSPSTVAHEDVAAPRPRAAIAPATPAARSDAHAAALPGVGPLTLAAIPGESRQVVLVTGTGQDSSSATVRLYERSPAGWRPAATAWQAHNALDGWTADHHLDDLRTPEGVFTLTDAGGFLPNPGSKLPYDHSSGFTISGTGFEGEPLAGSFDYVIAINDNRRTGVSPLDTVRPLGAAKGGGIWLHVDHGGPTHGCVSVAATAMRTLLRALDPAQHPVIVMGDPGFLAR